MLAGRSRSSWLTFIPIPHTTRPPVASSRIPATLWPSTSTSFGHFTSIGTPASRSSAAATASPATSDSCGNGAVGGRPQQHREEQAVAGSSSQRPARAAPAGRLVLGHGNGAVWVVAVAEHVLRRAGLVEVEVRLAEPTAEQRADALRLELTHRR